MLIERQPVSVGLTPRSWQSSGYGAHPRSGRRTTPCADKYPSAINAAITEEITRTAVATSSRSAKPAERWPSRQADCSARGTYRYNRLGRQVRPAGGYPPEEDGIDWRVSINDYGVEALEAAE